jgi:hypothetical protein
MLVTYPTKTLKLSKSVKATLIAVVKITSFLYTQAPPRVSYNLFSNNLNLTLMEINIFSSQTR